MTSSYSFGAALVAVPLLLSACASLPPDGGRGDLAQLVTERGMTLPEQKTDADIAAFLADNISGSLTMEQAVAIALMQNPRLRMAYAGLGLAAADIYDAGRLSNPRLSVGAMFGAGDEFMFGLSQSFSDLIFLKARSKIARSDFARVRAEAGQDILDVASDVERAYVAFVAAQQTALMRGRIADAAEVGAELAGRFHAAGNISQLELLIEQAAASDARLARLAAEQEAEIAYAALNRLMGFREEGGWVIDAELPLPDQPDPMADGLVERAFTHRLDLEAKREAIKARAAEHGLSRKLRWFSADIGVSHEREEGGIRRTGPTLGLELPLFNQGSGRIARAAASLEAAAAGLAAAELEVANKIRADVARLMKTRARVEEYGQTLLPARAVIVARMQEEVNFMLRGPFDLMRARVAEYEAGEMYIAAVRDYWIARIELAREVGDPQASFPGAASLKPDTAGDQHMDQHHHHGEHQ